MSHGNLQNETAIVTGGAYGFGEGIVNKFIREGANVIIMDIDSDNGIRVQSNQPTRSAVFVRGDVSNENDWKAVRDTTLKTYGRIDIVVNNAEISSLNVPEDMFDRLHSVNVKNIYHSARVIVPVMQQQGGGGVFVNIYSMGSLRPRPNFAWYAATKGAVSAATKCLAAELAKDNIRLNTVCPVAGETGMTPLILGNPDTHEARGSILSGIPLGRFATPADVANATAFLASDEASFVTRVELPVDGGRALN
ncbi:NAD(P)-binding protein [Aspergillus ibericus CBS 121593]|uniref:NAD(P)-binding protein n=1 Tax=Aspergillus ibericus CBS 121593 TaxID=1448316 RepID=A0A395H7J1_9EURO|nr:NAD(P)-binding protein [Aspergillus ibericus CBS 121593]RAL03911.1 NAD(P)-binding protein [Aspergillus ibericus CBS 121593]